VLTQPEEIEFVLTNPKLIKKAAEYKVLRESIMGQGIFSIEDTKKWKHNRYSYLLTLVQKTSD
jgi:cytochrome P450 family 4